LNEKKLALYLSDFFSIYITIAYGVILWNSENFLLLWAASAMLFGIIPQWVFEKTGTRAGSAGKVRWVMQSEYVASILSGFAALILLQAPTEALAYSLALCAGQIIVLAFVPVWKISGHAFGTVTTLAFLYDFGSLAALPALVLWGVFFWARVRVGAHTVNQYLAGSAGGLVFSLIAKVLLPG